MNSYYKNQRVLNAGLFIVLFFCFSTVAAQQRKQNRNIIFQAADMEVALRLAKQQHKIIFVDAYAIWCAPCKQLKATTFRDKKVAGYFNAHFINATIDVEKGSGPNFSDQYAVDSYPTLLFINENGRLVKKREGFADAGTLLAMAESIH